MASPPSSTEPLASPPTFIPTLPQPTKPLPYRPPPLGIRIRPALFSDAPVASRVLSASFWDDPMAGNYLHPKRADYPESFNFWFLQFVRGHLLEPNRRAWVAVDETQGDKVVGFCDWERQGPKGVRAEYAARDTLGLKVKRFGLRIWDYVAKFIWPIRCLNQENLSFWFQGMTKMFPRVLGPKRVESWYLELLVVSPEYQGKGIGPALVLHGLKHTAEKDGLPATVVASHVGEPMYRKLGWVEKGLTSTDELEGAPGGSLKVWDWTATEEIE